MFFNDGNQKPCSRVGLIDSIVPGTWKYYYTNLERPNLPSIHTNYYLMWACAYRKGFLQVLTQHDLVFQCLTRVHVFFSLYIFTAYIR